MNEVNLTDRIKHEMAIAEAKAWEALAGYKFWMFGYHAAKWVQLSQLLGRPHPSPFRPAVDLAREKADR